MREKFNPDESKNIFRELDPDDTGKVSLDRTYISFTC